MALSINDPGEPASRDLRLQAQALESSGDHEQAAATWARVAALATGNARAAALFCQAEIVGGALGRSDEAAALRRRALLADPGHPETLAALALQAASSEDWLLRALLQSRRFEIAESEPDRAEIALDLARLERVRLHNPSAARGWIARGLESNPDHAALHEALAEIERERGRDDAVLEQLEHVIRLRREDTPAAVLLEAALLHAQRGATHRALPYLQRASARAPEDARVVDALVELLEQLDRYSDLADALERRVALAAEDPATRAPLLARLGRLHESKLFDPEAALEAFERAHAVDPRAPGVEQALGRLRAKLSGTAAIEDRRDDAGPDAALAAYEREAQVTHDRERLGVLIREIERLHTRRGTPDDALPWVQRWVAAGPEDPDALRALARLHDRPGHEPRLLATLDSLDRLLEPEEQLANRRRMAAVYASQERFEDAEQAYAQALALDPTDLASLEGRAAVLRRLGRSEELIEMLARLCERQAPSRRLETLCELAQLHERIDDTSGAIAVLQRAEDEGEAGDEVSDRLDDLLAGTRRLDELEQRLAQRAARHDAGTAEAVALDLRRAGILLDELGRPEDAAAVYRRVLEHAPESHEARSGMGRALRSSVDASRLAVFLQDQEDRASDAADRDRLALERAVLLEELLDDPEAALVLFERLATESQVPEVQRDAARRAEQLLEHRGEWSALRDHLLRRLGSSAAEDARLHERLARLCADRLDDDTGALDHLERLVKLDPQRADVWQILAGRYEQADRIEDWARALEAELATGTDHLRELSLRGRLADLYLHHLDRREQARAHFERIFELSPSNSTAAQFLVDTYEQEERFEDLISVLESRLASIDTSGEDPHATSRRTALRLQISHVRDARLGDLEGAISALEVALGEVGPDPVVAEPLAAAYQRAGYTMDLIELCQQAANAGLEAGERANWLVRLGDAHLARDEERAAAAAYRRALNERPGDRTLEASLRELHRSLGQRGPLAELLESELRQLAGTAEIPVRLELVELLRAARPEEALLHARRVLELAPRHAGAYDAAIQLAQALGRPQEQLAIIEARMRASRSPQETADGAVERARLLAGPLHRSDAAIASYRDALNADPSVHRGRAVRAELGALLEREQRWEEWLECWAWQMRDAAPEEGAQYLERAAQEAWNHISPDAALPWLERLKCLRPQALDVLARISLAHRELGHEEALLRALCAEAEASRDPDQRRRCHLERAKLLRARGDRGRALAALADAGPTPDVLRARESLERELDLHAQRATTLEALLALSGPDVALHRELAELYATRLASPDAAIRHWRAALVRIPSGSAARVEVLRSLAASERRVGRIERWARYVEEELAALDGAPVFDDRRRELRRELAIAYDEALARPDRALAHLRSLLDAGDAELLGDKTLKSLEAACLRLLRAEGNVVELEQRLARRLERVGGEAAEWLELAGLREETLRRSSAAQQAYRSALERDPGNLDALRGVRRCAERLGRWRDVADALERELEHASDRDPTERGALLRALGDLYWHRLQSTTRASRCYAAALESNAADFNALRALERLLEAMEDWRGALDLYESEVEVLGTTNPLRRREIWLHVACLARDRAADPERARHALRHAGAIAPLDPAQLSELAALHETVGDREAFVQTYAAWCDAPDAGARAVDHLRLARALEDLGRVRLAVARVEAAVAADPECAEAWDAAARLRAADGDLAGSAEALRRAALRMDDADAAQRLLDAAERMRGDDAPAALELLRSATERCPEHAAAQAARATLAADLGYDGEAQRAANAALEGATPLDDAARAAAARAGAQAARRQGREEAAAGLYTEVLRLQPDNDAALGEYGETLFALGDRAAARAALERRLARGDVYAERAAHRALLGSCLEIAEPEEALVHYEAALRDDPAQPRALEASVRILESLDRIEPGVLAIERWAHAAARGEQRATRLLRAAQWEMRRGGRGASAEQHLLDAIRADAGQAAAWIALTTLRLEAGRLEEAIEAADRAASFVTNPVDFGTLAYLQARAFEQRGARPDAASMFGIAAEGNPRRADAALAQARLLRGFGEWREAAVALASFAERHPDADDPALADVHEQLGRLRAGPLEDLDGAVLSYRRAIELAPERLEPRAALAELLSHRPGDRDEALEHHRIVLASHPTHTSCLRGALHIARARANASLVATGVAIQRALGIGSAYESEEDAHDAAPFVTREPRLSDSRFETLRQIAVEAASEIASALGGTAPIPEGASGEDSAAAFRSRVLQVQGELSAPALVFRSTQSVREALQLVALLVLEPEQVRGDGSLVNALSAALGKRRRRKLRRVLGDNASAADFVDVDFEAWRTEMRALAAAETLRRDATPLRTAIAALATDAKTDAELGDDAHLGPRVESDPVARAFVRRIVDDWLERV